MAALAIWGAALAAYLLFRLWYDGGRRLSAAEIDAFLADMGDRLAATGNSVPVMRAFLEADDGREFVMVNVVKAETGEVEDPKTGARVPGFTLLQRYSKQFMPVLLRNGGHPALVARKIAGYVDAWNVPPDPGWTVVGFMRYRSRRDMVRLVRDPAFTAGHPDKLLGTAATFSFPTHRLMSVYATPRVTVALALALAAALLHLALLGFPSP